MATHIAATFFVSNDPVTGLLETFAVFAVAFALRPLGGIFFGRPGDRLGRQRILVLTVLLMSGSTAAIGLIPSHESIGVWATVLLVAARCLQGFSAGGEYAGATIYVVEHSPDQHRARYSCAMSAATFFSFALAAGLGALLSFVRPAEAMGAWGWRLLFLLSVPMGLIAFHIRAKLHESPEFQAMLDDSASRPAPSLGTVVRTQWPAMLRLGGFMMLTAVSFYICSTYMATFLTKVVGLSQDLALFSSLISLSLATAFAPHGPRLGPHRAPPHHAGRRRAPGRPDHPGVHDRRPGNLRNRRTPSAPLPRRSSAGRVRAARRVTADTRASTTRGSKMAGRRPVPAPAGHSCFRLGRRPAGR
ncbi:hypothetical protein GCM10023081_13160 [Arthrobacter ginkgonis]|uniref:Major facilitator superfamily (MFS) profile domain-containing protein n=1 Tax=Arthrobacter ginkgonis TaxID=1630594 RepID=A0ABP7C3P4_9MICC